MTIALPAHPQAAPMSGSEGNAWLEWDTDNDQLHLSPGALALLRLAPTAAPKNETEFSGLFDKPNRNKLAIAFEDILTQKQQVSLELLRQTSAGTQVILLHGALDPSREGRVVVVNLEDATDSSDGLQQIAANRRFETFITLIQRDHAYFDSVPLGLMMVSAGFITQANPKLTEILATPAPNLIGEPIFRVLSSKQAYDHYMEIVWGDAGEGSQDYVETEFENDDGSLIWLSVRISRINQPGAENACLCILEDITARKALEQDVWNGLAETISAKEATENASRIKSDFLAMVSHEIRTPLSAVIGMQKLALRDADLKEKTRKHLEMAQTNAEFLLDLLNDILDFSKIEASKLLLENVDFSLRHLVSESGSLLMERAAAKNIALDISIDEAVPDTLIGDPARLKQIMLNLIGNGIKFTDKGGVSLGVTLERQMADINHIRFDVKDSGVGIQPEAQKKLFQKFMQVDASTTRRFGGTGLGLAICKQLVDLMQGDISLTSAPGQGSCFTFVVPLGTGTAPANILPTILTPHSHQLNVLYAEDFLPNQIIIQGLVEEMGHRIEIVENGRKALEALPLRSYDVILMDGRMPEMDGATAIRLIRAGGDGKFYIPDPKIRIIMLTANAGDENRQFYLSCGADDFLAKPVDEGLLHQSLAQVIDARLAAGAALLPLVQGGTEALERLFGGTEPSMGSIAPSHIAPRKDGDEEKRPDLRERLLQAFRADLSPRLKALADAYARRDAPSLSNIFHSLKGSAGYIWPGGPLQDMSSKLEKAADCEDWQTIAKEMPSFLDMLNDIAKGTV
ncbi:MAG: response regulator [Roseomonas sp.]|nr:response regulator [Roseomonas sp.]MCA3329743.1 response regulator [Roseomonas sp.]MCA3334400.1 response regulator [Roseomonas sp.]MCA3347187.1 response regulator [Roseomonas sp.]MCA3353880.1 response regulator [Roseomonas sp.]